MTVFYCADFRKAGFAENKSCCDSCHDDNDMMIPMVELYCPSDKEKWASICCAVSMGTFNELSMDDWNKLDALRGQDGGKNG